MTTLDGMMFLLIALIVWFVVFPALEDAITGDCMSLDEFCDRCERQNFTGWVATGCCTQGCDAYKGECAKK